MSEPPGRPAGAERETGQAVVELALVLPVLILVILIVLDFGRVFSVHIALANAAREGARTCSLLQADANKTTRTRTRVREDLGGRVAFVESATVCDTAAAGQPVTVAARGTFTPLTPVIRQVTGATMTLEARATMVVWG